MSIRYASICGNDTFCGKKRISSLRNVPYRYGTSRILVTPGWRYIRPASHVLRVASTIDSTHIAMYTYLDQASQRRKERPVVFVSIIMGDLLMVFGIDTATLLKNSRNTSDTSKLECWKITNCIGYDLLPHCV